MDTMETLEREAARLEKRTRIGDGPRSWFCFLGIFAGPAVKAFLFQSDWYSSLENPAFHSHMVQWLMFTVSMIVLFVFFSRFFELAEEDAAEELAGIKARIKALGRVRNGKRKKR